MLFLNVHYCVLLQTERAFQKQGNVFLNKKKLLVSNKAMKLPRFYRSVGLGFKTPREVCSCF